LELFSRTSTIPTVSVSSAESLPSPNLVAYNL